MDSDSSDSGPSPTYLVSTPSQHNRSGRFRLSLVVNPQKDEIVDHFILRRNEFVNQGLHQHRFEYDYGFAVDSEGNQDACICIRSLDCRWTFEQKKVAYAGQIGLFCNLYEHPAPAVAPDAARAAAWAQMHAIFANKTGSHRDQLPQQSVSHLCHNPRCTRHVVLETKRANEKRRHCEAIMRNYQENLEAKRYENNLEPDPARTAKKTVKFFHRKGLCQCNPRCGSVVGN